MPKRADIKSVMIIGSGPIVIGQACEFDYSGVQACKALKAQGYRVVLVNSNPATIMTDPQFSDATYIEPLTAETCQQILEKENPDALLPTVGGQTALNLAVQLQECGALDHYGVELIGASLESIQLAEDRRLFNQTMREIGLKAPDSLVVSSVAGALEFAGQIGYPVLIRPSFTMGGAGGGVAYDEDELRQVAANGLRQSPVGQALVDKSLLGWKEYELELMRDGKGNFVVVCSIENLDPMGVHTGDSITIAPAQTLTDRELQRLRNMSRKLFDRIGITTGGANVQFAINPADGEVNVIEMNPRVSRSSALASKATGFPIAKIAALVAVGYALDEIPNDITRVTPASFEPSLDYIVVKIPRWDFKKFAGADPVLGPQMKAVGEVMAIGRTFPEALQKAVRSLDIGMDGFGEPSMAPQPREALSVPTAQRLFQVADAIADGVDPMEIIERTRFDPWFLQQMRALIDVHNQYAGVGKQLYDLETADLLKLKRYGFSDRAIGRMVGVDQFAARARRLSLNVAANFYRVDTCAAEFEALTPYLYSTYEPECEAAPTQREKVMILGGGPNRIGQGIEFDYCCVHACFALRDLGYETIMVNCNPETVSTDYDTADRLYFEPLTAEDVMNIVDREQPAGILAQFGGQTPLNIAGDLERMGAPIWGTSVDTIDLAEDRERFNAMMRRLNIAQPAGATARTRAEAAEAAGRIGYPVLIRPSYVLGGRGMAIVFDEAQLLAWLDEHVEWLGHPTLIDQFLDDAYEVDVDALCDGETVTIGGIMQHIEEAGVHSGDSASVLPPYKISYFHLDIIRDYTRRIGLALGVKGLFNIQFAVKDDEVYALEANPRASRTVPFVSKATGKPLARYAAQIAAGRSLKELGFVEEPAVSGFFIKEAVFPFQKFPGVDTRLGPEMRSTGEVMGHASTFGHAFVKSQASAGLPLPRDGCVFISVNDFDKPVVAKIARELRKRGFRLLATDGTARWLNQLGIRAGRVNKISQGSPHVIDAMNGGEIDLIINTPRGSQAHADGAEIRSQAYALSIPIVTTMSAAAATAQGIKRMSEEPLTVRSLQAHYASAR